MPRQPYTPRNCMAVLLKGQPAPYLGSSQCARCSEPAAYLSVFGDQYQAVCNAHARGFRLRHGLTAVVEPAPASLPEPIKLTRKRASRKGASNA
jgi:hypothetical protein